MLTPQRNIKLAHMLPEGEGRGGAGVRGNGPWKVQTAGVWQLAPEVRKASFTLGPY